MWRDVFWLVKKELRYNFASFIFTLMVVIIVSFLTSYLFLSLEDPVTDGEFIFGNSFIIDVLLVGVTPSFAVLFMSSPYLRLRTIKEDPFSKRMALYRLLPIPVKTLALSRTVLMLSIFTLMSAVFFSMFFWILQSYELVLLTPEQLLLFILFWLGYALALGGFNMYVEVGMTGKMLHIIPYIAMLILIGMHLFFRWTWGFSLVEGSIMLIQSYHWLPVVISSVIGVASCYVWYKLLLKRFAVRDYV